MKNTILATALLIALFITSNTNAQVGIGVSTANINASAQLDVTSTSKGFLPPRMTQTQRDLIAVTSASAGLTIWCTNCGVRGELEVYDGVTWTNMMGTSSAPVLINIGTQVWSNKNLDVSTYRNGDPITYVSDPTVWAGLTTGAWCYHNNNPANGALYGKLYNWYAVNDSRGLAPAGYHLPTDTEWTTLITTLGGASVAGGKMKLAGTTWWNTPNTGADNSSGFSGLPGSWRNYVGQYVSIGGEGVWWSATEIIITQGRYFRLASNSATCYIAGNSKNDGRSVRCLRD